jgi:hypothetical protein
MYSFNHLPLEAEFETKCSTPRTRVHSLCQLLCSNGNLDLNTSLDVDDDLLNNLGWSVEVNEACGDHVNSAVCSLVATG